MPSKPIRFSKGVMTIDGAPEEAPRDLFDAEVLRMSEVQAIANPTAYGVDPGTFPWLKAPWGQWLDDAYAGYGLARRFYTFSTTTDPARAAFPETFGFWDRGGASFRDVIPHVIGVRDPEQAHVEATPHGLYIPSDRDVDYIALPMDEFGQRGPALRWTLQAPVYRVADFPDLQTTDPDAKSMRVDWELMVSTGTKKVDVYRTRSLHRDDYTSKTDGDDESYYYLGTYGVMDVTGYPDKLAVRFKDDKNWPDVSDMPADTDPLIEDVDALGTVYDEAETVWHRPFGVFYARADGAPFPDSIHGQDHIKHPFARVMYNHGGVMLFGDVQFPTKQPALTTPAGGGSTYLRYLQLEYATPEGPVYGPALNVVSTNLRVRNQGEAALLVFAKTAADPNWKLIRRDEAGPDGLYYALISDEDYANAEELAPGVQHYPVTDYIAEPESVLSADVNRPWSMTYQGFQVPDGGRIVAITGARLAEEESLKAYDFYTFSEAGSYVVQRDGYTFLPDVLLAGVGCTETAAGPVVAPTREGVVFYGTDNRLYEVRGRTSTQIDEAIPGLWTEVRAVAFLDDYDLVAAATDTGVWFYDTDLREWRGHLDVDAVNVDTDLTDKLFVFRLSDASNVQWDRNGARRQTAAVEAQPMEPTTDMHVADVVADFDPITTTVEATYLQGNPELTVGANPFVAADEGGQYNLVGAGRNRNGDAVDTSGTLLTSTPPTVSPAPRNTGAGTLTVGRPATFDLTVVEGRNNRERRLTFKLTPNDDANPDLQGRSVVTRMSGFDRLRSIAIVVGTTHPIS